MLKKCICIAAIVMGILLMHSCIKEDLNKISDDYQWKPSISLPLRSIVFTAKDFKVPPSEIDNTNPPVFSKSIEFEFDDIYDNSEYIDSLMLRMEIKNTFPAQLEVAAYYMDDQGGIIQNIVLNPPLTLNKPVFDADGNITQVETAVYDHRLDKADITALGQTKSILIRAKIKDLEHSPEVLNKSDEWSIDISIGLRSALNVSTDEI